VLNHSRAAGRAIPDLYGLFESLEEATLAPHRPKFSPQPSRLTQITAPEGCRYRIGFLNRLAFERIHA
jgi:hypothetical protein